MRRIVILLVAAALVTVTLAMSGLGTGPAIAAKDGRGGAKGGNNFSCTNGTTTVIVGGNERKALEQQGYTCTHV